MTLVNSTACRTASATAQRRITDTPWHRGANAPLLDIRAKVGVSSSPTATGNQAIAGVGFQPKAVLPFGNGHSATGAITDGLLHFGAGTQSSNSAVCASSVHGVTTSSTHRRHHNSRAISTVFNNVVGIESSLQSFGSDGFTLNWATVLGVPIVFNHICLGGADLEVSLTQHQLNGTNSSQSFAHGLSGAPTGLLFFSMGSTATPPSTQTFAAMSIGAWAASGQWRASATSNHGVTTTETRRCLYTTGVIGQGHTSISRMMAVSSVDATNVNCTYPVTSGTDQHIFFMLAIRGAKCQTGTFNFNGSTSPVTIATPGISPRLFLPVFVPLGVQTINTILGDANIAIGACDGTNTISCGLTDRDAQTTTNARRFQSSTIFQEYNTVGTMITESTAAFSGQSVVITPTTVNASSYGQAAYLVIGA